MANIVKKSGQVFWVDEDGNETLEKHISTLKKHRDKCVEKVIKLALPLEEKIKASKTQIAKSVDDYLKYAIKDLEFKVKEKWQGNITLYDFAKDAKVTVSINKKIAFNEQLQVAKMLIDDCIKDWIKGADDKVISLIDKAFKVGKKGTVDAHLIFSLRELKFKDTKWLEAMEKINQAVVIENTRKYYTIEVKQMDGNYRKVRLNFSAV